VPLLGVILVIARGIEPPLPVLSCVVKPNPEVMNPKFASHSSHPLWLPFLLFDTVIIVM